MFKGAQNGFKESLLLIFTSLNRKNILESGFFYWLSKRFWDKAVLMLMSRLLLEFAYLITSVT
jgi:hypothetical protein